MMSPEEKEKIVKAYRKLDSLLRKHLPFKREGSIHADVHLKLKQSRFSFEMSWDEHEDKHLTESEEVVEIGN